jgi:hypothetical protein
MAKVARISTLLAAVPASRPSTSDEDELISDVLNDPDFRIRVRAMALMPLIKNRARATITLMACIRERDPNRTGNGNVPFYAAGYLADMNATDAIPSITEWIKYLEDGNPYAPDVVAMMLQRSRSDLARLSRAAGTRPTATRHTSSVW